MSDLPRGKTCRPPRYGSLHARYNMRTRELEAVKFDE
jgi:hypothetical protein